jgi:hypothetical protein
MTPYRERLAVAAIVVLPLTGCGGEERARSDARIERAAATELATRSEEIARLLDAGETCDAARRADELRARTRARMADGSVPASLRAELMASVDALADELVCEAPPPPPPPPPPPTSPPPPPPDDSIEIGGHDVKLLDVNNRRDRLQVEVDGRVYTVEEGARFDETFRLVNIDGNCARFLFGDQSFTLCDRRGN